MDFFVALLSIIMIDLVLAGDNAIVIGMAARTLPAHQQKRAIIWGTVGAIVIRAVSTVAVVWLLGLTGLKLVGGCLLIWIAFKLLTEKKGDGNHVKEGMGLWKAISTIMIADTVMGLDNVLAVAGAAHGDFLLVVVGLLISIPIMVYGSTLVIKLMDRFPWLIYLGAGVLAWTAAKMIVHEGFVSRALEKVDVKLYKALEGVQMSSGLAVVIVLAGTMAAGWLYNRRERTKLEKIIQKMSDDEEKARRTATA